MKRLWQCLFTLCLFWGSLPLARADMVVEVVGVGSQQYSLAIAPFLGEPALNQPLTPVIGNDLLRSGLFQIHSIATPAPSGVEQLDWNTIKASGAQYVLFGQVDVTGNELLVQFWLVDSLNRREVLGIQKRAPVSSSRRLAHQIADQVFEAITGEPGAFSSRIAYVLKRSSSRFELQVADSDGYGAQSVLVSQKPIMSPKWSPDGGKLAYVSFENQKPVVYVHELSSGRRWAAANFKGSNSAPAWSPDGSRLAVVLTQDGGSQIYTVSAGGGNLRRLTYSGEINTEPVFSPDGSSIYFTSNRGGGPQIYRMNPDGSNAQRVTFEGGYNAGPKLSPDGSTLLYVTQAGGFRVAAMDLATRSVTILSDSSQDDSPSFSPNGKMVLFETDSGRQGTLVVVSRDGKTRQLLRTQGGEVRQPVWGPMVR